MSERAIASASASTTPLPIYPYYCRSLSLTLGRWCPFTAADVFRLEEVQGYEGQQIYFWKNHMIKYVRLTGVIVAVDEQSGWAVFTLDDSSGVNIEVSCKAPPKLETPLEPTAGDAKSTTLGPNAQSVTTTAIEQRRLVSPDGPDLTGIDVGSVVKVKGGIGAFRGQRLIRLNIITIMGDTNAEVKCWNDMIVFKKDVLSTPWVVSKEQLEKCRLEEDREARWKAEKEAKIKKEEVKRKKDDMRRYLREKAKELRENQRQVPGQGENALMGGDFEKSRREVRRQENHTPSLEAYEKNASTLKHGRHEGLDAVNRANYPSKAARRAAGKYDALGI